MAATEAELAAIRDHVGDQPPDADLQELWNRLGDVDAVALAVIRRRRAEMLARPARLTVEGDYTEEWTRNLDALAAQEAALAAAVSTGDADPGIVRVATLRRSGRTR